MRVVLIRDAAVRFTKGTELDVSEAEAKRLIAFTNAKACPDETVKTANEEEPPKPKKKGKK